jgi:hypothetical protein
MKFNDFRVLAFTFAVATSGLAHAGPISFNDTNCQASSASSPITCSATVSGVNYGAAVTGWSAPGTGKFASAAIAYYPYSGVGITSLNESTASPDHAIDNNGGTEALLINFGLDNFALNQLSIGWFSGDSDVSILRYTGTQAPTLGNRTVADLKSAAGWEWVGDYANLSTSTALNFNNSGDIKTGSWWLVSAYNSAYSGVAATGNLGNGNDYFKISGFGGTTVAKAVTPPTPGTSVPEPGTFALFGIAMLGFAAARRKSKTM